MPDRVIGIIHVQRIWKRVKIAFQERKRSQAKRRARQKCSKTGVSLMCLRKRKETRVLAQSLSAQWGLGHVEPGRPLQGHWLSLRVRWEPSSDLHIRRVPLPCRAYPVEARVEARSPLVSPWGNPGDTIAAWPAVVMVEGARRFLCWTYLDGGASMATHARRARCRRNQQVETDSKVRPEHLEGWRAVELRITTMISC